MKRMRLIPVALAILMLCSCTKPQGTAPEPPCPDSREAQAPSEASSFDSRETQPPSEASSSDSMADSPDGGCIPESEAPSLPHSADLQPAEASAALSPHRSDAEAPETSEASQTAEAKPHPDLAPQIPEAPFSPTDLEPYSGQPCIAVNGGVPYFSEEELTASSFALFSELDESGRCGAAYACVGLDLMPTQERGAIGNVRPTGWHTVKYNGIIDGNYLYNRCHLIGYLLCGENANEKNLITGTRYLNVQGMLPFENKVADYVAETGNHVLYRVTPVFDGDNLLASGVLMEAQSVEDNGGGVSFCVYIYNVQPGIVIDYATGESAIAPDAQAPESDSPAIPAAPESTSAPPESGSESAAAPPKQNPEPSETPPQESAEEPASEPVASQEEQPQETPYILNTNTKKFHYPSCPSVKQMKEKNKQDYTGSREDVISMGYEPCKNCCP